MNSNVGIIQSNISNKDFLYSFLMLIKSKLKSISLLSSLFLFSFSMFDFKILFSITKISLAQYKTAFQILSVL